MRKLVALLACFGVVSAEAACRCECVNGQQTTICTSALDIKPICPARVCPMVPPSIAPIRTPPIPPVGTARCSQQQVFNTATNRYEWREICR